MHKISDFMTSSSRFCSSIAYLVMTEWNAHKNKSRAVIDKLMIWRPAMLFQTIMTFLITTKVKKHLLVVVELLM